MVKTSRDILNISREIKIKKVKNKVFFNIFFLVLDFFRIYSLLLISHTELYLLLKKKNQSISSFIIHFLARRWWRKKKWSKKCAFFFIFCQIPDRTFNWHFCASNCWSVIFWWIFLETWRDKKKLNLDLWFLSLSLSLSFFGLFPR